MFYGSLVNIFIVLVCYAKKILATLLGSLGATFFAEVEKVE
jgi:hypothetical protein